MQVLRTGSFPHQMYVARCACPDGSEQPTRNYTGHAIAPPRCSKCGRRYQLDIELMKPAAKL